MAGLADRLQALATRFGLPAQAPAQLERILVELERAEISVTSVREPERAVDVHVADSLIALDLAAVRSARAIADLGSGGGFPGLALACALPGAEVRLVESTAKKCAFLERTARAAGLANVTVVNARAEAWPAGLGAHDLVTARALAPLPVLVEYAAPLLTVGGSLVAWKGAPDAREVADGAAAAAALAMEPAGAVAQEPQEWAVNRTLYVYSKVADTPPGYPRAAGIARKRPLKA